MRLVAWPMANHLTEEQNRFTFLVCARPSPGDISRRPLSQQMLMIWKDLTKII